ncbi:tripartite tricarboxylate transporter TctB family protein [Marinomonas sp.]|jgi:putative tricarboxylic transport membrane protein|uniref:tripartite tricarboxylate transporter TctB family protein n=1 Tax=Marinomonas sp. TaxID=1904862 RepID=UPI003A90A3EF
MNKAKIELLSSIVVTIFSVFGLIEAWGYSATSGFLPRIVLFIMLALSLIWVAQSLKSILQFKSQEKTADFEWGKFFLIISSSTLFVLGISYLGVITSSVIFTPLLALGLGYRNVKNVTIAAFVFCTLIYVIFRVVLRIPLPPEAISVLLMG